MAESMSDSDKTAIRRLLLERVPQADRRGKILQLAAALGDAMEEDDDWYSAIYHYALPENWQELERDHQEFVVGGSIDFSKFDLSKRQRRGR